MRPVLRLSSCLAVTSLLLAPGARAQSVWDGGGTNDNWSTQTNWLGDVAPALVTTNYLYLAGVTRLTPVVNSNWTAQGLVISNNAGAFTLSGSNLTLTANANAPGFPYTFEHRGSSNFVMNNTIVLPATTTNPRRQFYLSGSGFATFNGGITNTGTGETALMIRGTGSGQGRINGRITIDTNVVSKTDTATWTIGSGTNVWGMTAIGSTGTLRIALNDALPTNTVIAFADNARLDLSNFNQTVVGLTGTGVVRTGLGAGGRFTVADDGANRSFFGTIVDNGSLNKRGPGVLNLLAANSFTGGVVVGEGTLRVGANGKLANSAANAVVISNGATLAISNVNAFVSDHTATLLAPITVLAGGTLKDEGKEMRLGAVFLQGGTILADGGSATYGAFYLADTVTVAGTSASIITNTAVANGFFPLGPTSRFDVADATGSPASDLDVYARLADRPNNAGFASLTKSGAGTMTLYGNHSLSGTLWIAAGRVSLDATAGLSNATVFTAAGATYDLTALGTYGFSNVQTLLGSGVITGLDLTVAGAARIAPGTLDLAGALTLNVNALSLTSTYTNYFDLTNDTALAGGNDLLVLNNASLFAPGNSQIRINPVGRLTTGTYRLINYTPGTRSGSFAPVVLGNTTRDTWAIDDATDGQINLQVSGVTNAALVWSANTTANWDLATTNWTDLLLLAPGRFYDNDEVFFTDSGATSNLVSLTATVKPYATTVSSSSNYTFQGTGRISGIGGAPASLTKDGSGTLTILNTNDYPGLTVVSNGEIVVGNGGAVGSLGTGAVQIEAPATVTYHRNDNFVLANAFTGTGSLRAKGSGVSAQGSFDITGVNTGFTGTILATNVRLVVNAASDVGNASLLRAQSGGQFYVLTTVTNPVEIAGLGWLEGVGLLGAVRLQGGNLQSPVTLASNARISAFNGDGALSGSISGPYELELWGSEAGRILQMGASAPQTYASTRISSNLTVFVTNVNALSQGPLVLNRGTLRVNGNDLTFTNLSSTASGGTLMNGSSTAATITVGSDGSSQTFSGVFQNGVFAPGGILHVNASNAPLHLTKVGAGNLTLLNNTAGGTNRVTGGSVTIGNGTWTGPLRVEAGVSAVLQGGSGLVGEYYNVLVTQATFNTLSTWNADLARYAPMVLFKSTAVDTNFDFGSAGANFPPGIAATGNSNIQARWSGKFLAPTNGLYTFITLSDDGAGVWVDGTNVVLNNRFGGYNGSDKTGTVTLAQGPHDITIGFFQGGGGIGFTVDYVPPGGTRGRLWNSLLADGAAVGSLSGPAGAALYVSNGISLVAQAQNDTFAGTISGDGGLRKVGPAALTLAAAATYTGETVVAGGTLAIDGTLPSSPVTVISGGTLGGTGSIGAAVSVQNGALINPALAGTVGQLSLAGPVVYAAGATTVVDFAAGTNDTLAFAGSLDGNGSVVAVNPAVALADGLYPFAPYNTLVAPPRAAVFNLNPAIGGAKSLYLDYSVPNLIQIGVAARPAVLAWNSASSVVWNVAGAVNWSNSASGVNDVFYDGEAVLFDDRAGVTQIVNIAAGVTVQPSVVTFAVAVNVYTVQLAGAMAGTGSVVKTGTGSVTIADSTASTINRNFMTGDTIVEGGRLLLNGPNDGTPVLGLGQVIVRPGGILQSDSANVYGLQQTGFVQRLVIDGGTLRPNANTHFNQLVLRSNAVAEAHTSGSGAGLDAYAISNVLAQITVESSSSTITNAARITFGNSTNNTLFSIEDGPAAVDAEFQGIVGQASDSRYVLITNAGTMVLSGAADNGYFRAIVSNGRLILAKTSSPAVHAVGGNLSNLVLNGGTVQLGGTGGDQIYNNADVFLNGGTFDLNGLSETYDALGGTGGAILNSAAGTIVTNAIGAGSTAGTYFGSIQDGAGVVVLVKTGTAVQVLAGTNTYTGATRIQEGTLNLSNAAANAVASTDLVLNDGAGTAVLLLGRSDQIPDNAVITFNSGTTSGNSGKLQMMGQSETIGGLAIAAGSQSVIQNVETEVINTDGTLTIGGAGDSVLPEVVRDRSGGTGTGRLAIVKSGAGTLTLRGGNTSIYTGPTTVNGGTFFVDGTLAAASAPMTVASGGTLGGTGSVARGVVVSSGGVVLPGHLTNIAALTVTTLTANAGGSLNLLVGGTGANLRVTGNNGFAVPASGQATVVVQTVLAVGTYGLIDYTGAVQNGSVAANLALAAPPRSTAALFDNTGNTMVELLVSSVGESIKWSGAQDNLWNVDTAVNWKTQIGLADTTYLQPGAVGDAVLFDDSATGNFSIDLAATVSPASLTVSNEVNDYVLAGQAVAGTVGLTKLGAASLTLSNIDLAYAGATLVNGGTLKLDTLTGFAGSLVNQSTVELAAASGNWNLGSGRVLSGGGTFRKTGAGTVSLDNAIVSATGAIQIAGGVLRNSGNGTVWTGAAADLDVASGAAFDLRGDSVRFDALTGAGTITNSYGNLQAETLALGAGDGSGLFSGTIRDSGTQLAGENQGTIALLKTGRGTQTLAGVHGYAGATIIDQGELAYGADNSVRTLFFGAAAGSTNFARLDLTAASLTASAWTNQFTSTTATSLVLVAAGRTLTINGPVQIGSSLTNTVCAQKIAGDGTLVVSHTNGLVRLGGWTGAADFPTRATLDLSQLAVASIDVGAGTVQVGNGDNSANFPSRMLLAATSTITAANLNIGPSQIGSQHVFLFGAVSNVLRIDNLNIGTGTRDRAYVGFTNATGSLVLRDRAGTGRATVTIGRTTPDNTGYSGPTVVDLRGHAVDLLVSTLNLGVAGRKGITTNEFYFDTGMLDVQRIQMSLNPNLTQLVSVLSIGGGTVNIGTNGVTLASNGISTVTLSGGTITSGSDFLKSPGGTGVVTFTLSGATLDLQGRTLGSTAKLDTVVFGAGTLANVGEFNAGAPWTKTSTGTLIIAGSNGVSGPGYVSNGALIVNGTLGTGGVTAVAGTTVGGSGVIGGSLISDGLVSPGSSAGILTIGGDFVLASALSSTQLVEIGGTTPGSGHDQIVVSNNAYAQGALDVRLIGGHTPVAGNAYTVLVAATVSGPYSSLSLPALATNLGWDVQYQPGAVVLAVTGGVTLTGYDLAATTVLNGLSGYQDDADGDGYANLLEYVTGGSLTNPGTQARMQAARTNNMLALKFTRDTAATDATIYVEGSFTATNGAVWTPVATNIGGTWGGATNVTESGASPVNVTVQDVVSPATNRFLRLHVTRP